MRHLLRLRRSAADLQLLRLAAALDTLPAEHRETYQLVAVDGLSIPAVADRLKVAPEVVQERLVTSLVQLKARTDDTRPPGGWRRLCLFGRRR